MVKVKVCGITNIEDALKAVYYGAYALGFVFYKKSPRYVSPSRARKIIEALPPFITPVGVFVNQKERAVMDVCRFTRIKTVQFHGDEKPVYCKRFKDFKIIKAFRVGTVFFPEMVNKYKVDSYLFDTYQEDVHGGTGKKFNWDKISKYKFDKPVVLSGGLNPDNIKEAIEQVNPFAVDVSSGLEKAPGIKNPRLIRSFFENLRSF